MLGQYINLVLRLVTVFTTKKGNSQNSLSDIG